MFESYNSRGLHGVIWAMYVVSDGDNIMLNVDANNLYWCGMSNKIHKMLIMFSSWKFDFR